METESSSAADTALDADVLELRKTAALLRELAQMKAEGLIDDAEYQRMRKSELRTRMMRAAGFGRRCSTARA